MSAIATSPAESGTARRGRPPQNATPLWSPPTRGTWLDKSARRMIALLGKIPDTEGLDLDYCYPALVSLLERERDKVMAASGVSLPVAERWFTEQVLAAMAYQVASRLDDDLEEDDGDPFADPASVLVPLPTLGDSLQALQLSARNALRYGQVEFAGEVMEASQQLLGLLGAKGRYRRAPDGNDAVAVPRAGVAMLSRLLRECAQATTQHQYPFAGMTPEDGGDHMVALSGCLRVMLV